MMVFIGLLQSPATCFAAERNKGKKMRQFLFLCTHRKLVHHQLMKVVITFLIPSSSLFFSLAFSDMNNYNIKFNIGKLRDFTARLSHCARFVSTFRSEISSERLRQQSHVVIRSPHSVFSPLLGLPSFSTSYIVNSHTPRISDKQYEKFYSLSELTEQK